MNAKTWEEAVSWLRQQPDQEELVKACFYDDPLPAAAERYFNSSEWAAVRHFLPAGNGHALDVGAGRGIASYALAKEGFSVTALEPDSSLLVGAGAIRSLADASGQSIVVEQNWGERMPFADETFDVVHARQVLHHANDLGQLCSEASRVLKTSGIFIATREHVLSKKRDLKIFQENHSLHKLYGGESAYLLREYKQAIKQAGIRLTSVFNPYSSDINLYPMTTRQLKMRVASKLGVKTSWIPDFAMEFLGELDKTPGRLYTFIGYKHG